MSKTKIMMWGLLGLATLVGSTGFGIAWYFTSQGLFPPWQVSGLDKCSEYRLKFWGPKCGNLRKTKDFVFEELSFTGAGRGKWKRKTPAWKVSAAAQKPGFIQMKKPSCPEKGQCAVVFMHGGGTDRRQGYRYLKYFLSRGFDFYMPDYVCHGEAVCPVRGLQFGYSEKDDARAVFNGIRNSYRFVVLMGNSVGASSVLMALPELEGNPDGLILENPVYSIEMLIMKTTRLPALFPDFYRRMIYDFFMWRGESPKGVSAALSLQKAQARQVPLYFLHGSADTLTPSVHSQRLVEEYKGPARLEVFEGGKHAELWHSHEKQFKAGMDKFLGERLGAVF